MKSYIITIIIGIIMMGISFIVPSSYYQTLLFSMGIGLVAGVSAQLAKLFYWTRPERNEAYQAKLKEIRISMGDERKQLLRMKSGHMTYQLMTWLLLGLSVLFALLHMDAWLIALFFLLFVMSWVVGIIVYRFLDKRL